MTEPMEAKPIEQALVRQEQTQELTPMGMISSIVQQGADPEALERVTAWAERMQANEARRAFAQAMTNFKALCPTVAQWSKGHTNKYAKLVDIDEQIRPSLTQCQLSPSWRVTKNDKDWIEVECRVTHVMGHCEATSFGGPPDRGPGRNELQARASTLTYLERYTLKALLGIVDRDMPDNDGADGGTSASEKKVQSPSDPEADAKKAFWNAAQKKAGVKFTAPEVRNLFAAVQELSGQQSAADCLAFIEREDVRIGRDGTVTQVVDAQDALLATDLSQDRAAPAGPTAFPPQPPDAEPPFSPFVCELCGRGHAVKPARDRCTSAKCDGRIVANSPTWQCFSGHGFGYQEIVPTPLSTKGKCPVCDRAGHSMLGIFPAQLKE